jgi:hypothetical protein
VALPLIRHDLTVAQRAAALRRATGSAPTAEEWIADIADDPDGVWRSSWLQSCALHAMRSG